MTTEERIRNCLLIENMKKNKEAAERLGLRDTSRIDEKINGISIGNRIHAKQEGD